MSRCLTLAALTLIATAPLQAQQRVRIAPDTRKTVVTLNPFAVIAAYLTGDVEVKATPAVSIGAGTSIGGGDFDNYRSLEGKVRYYPGEKALQGFSVAATAGFASGDDYTYDPNNSTSTKRRLTRPTVGTELSYQWILGPSSRFVVVTGAGVKRLLGNKESSDLLDVEVLPTARLNIGFAF